MKEKIKKKLVKKSINIESEFIGIPVGPHKKKERKLDLTDEIKKFLKEPTNLESIKYILMRIEGPVSDFEFKNSEMKIYGFSRPSNKNHPKDFFIVIHSKNRHYKFFIDSFIFASLDFFKPEDLEKSDLKQYLAHALRNWLYDNQNQIIVI